MTDSTQSSTTSAARDGVTVVLLLPDALGEVDEVLLRASLGAAATPIRALVCLPDQKGIPLVGILARLGVATEVLLGPAVAAPPTSAFVARALPGTSSTDLTELALALSDVVLVSPTPADKSLPPALAALGKKIIAPGEPVPAVERIDFVHDLDPDAPTSRRAFGRRTCGRLEQFLVELFAFNWRRKDKGEHKGGVAESWRRLRRCFGRAWGPTAYFAPAGWEKLEPDRTVQASSPILSCFRALDRSALYGAYIHRDLVSLEHAGAAFAVFAAVAGHIDLGMAFWRDLGWAWFSEHIWGVAELITLVMVAAMVLRARMTNLQDRWTACRLGAEQLRIALMSMPLLVLPSALATADKPPPAKEQGRGRKETQYGFLALAQVKRAVRDHGLPRVDPAWTPMQAAEWVRLIVNDQIAYHRNNHAKLERAESGLRILTQLIFALAVIAVMAHFWSDSRLLILATAALPAFAAAVHGTGTRLGIVHRAALSGEMEESLAKIDEDLAKAATATPPEEAWDTLRRLAFRAAEAMGRENTSWHGLVRRYRDDLP
ncbi:MAG TPA: hypothetical protein VKX28_33130 [Xanthobacteraceae bacterium]|nr:hypothetical protein [Xanthobacteraceae bacterium]